MTETVRGHSLWFIPPPEIYDLFSDIISRLSKKYASENFDPHITLIGEIGGGQEDIVSKAARLASLLKPCGITLTKMGYFDEYYRSLFVCAEQSDAETIR